jgi:hypothetical protein
VLEDSDVVAFRSSPSDKYCHSLIKVNGTTADTYDLPPMATLEKIEQPGEWHAFGKPIQRRLFTVSVTFLLNPEFGRLDVRSLTHSRTQPLEERISRKGSGLFALRLGGSAPKRSHTQALPSSKNLIDLPS